MAKIVGFRIRNFRALRDVTLGFSSIQPTAKPLTPMTAVIGKNGVGKSTLFDAFGFLADCLRLGVEEACDARGRGGYEKIVSNGKEESIIYEIFYKEDESDDITSYTLSINIDSNKRPFVSVEILFQHRKGPGGDILKYLFLYLVKGRSIVWKGSEGHKEGDGIDIDDAKWRKILVSDVSTPVEGSEFVVLEDKRKLGIATLGSLKQHPKISAFRRFIEGWYLSYFTPDAARGLPLAGPQKHLNIHGDNLGNVVQFMEREHPKRFKEILNKISKRIPGISKIDTETSNDGRLLLRFNDKGFKDPFYAQQMSDGTLKIFAYLLLLEDPDPPPFLCIEEPENGLYHKLLELLVSEFREHAAREKGGSQVFVTTHQPYLVDALNPEEVWILEKGDNGFSTIRRASDDSLIENMVAEGLPLGGLWYSEYLDKRA
ncbi:MAG: AAA family ATPase [Pseudohongiellaceae bacterium]